MTERRLWEQMRNTEGYLVGRRPIEEPTPKDRCPAPEWERSWREYEVNHMGRPEIPLSEEDQRLMKLPANVLSYLSLGKAVRQGDLPLPQLEEFRTLQASLFNKFTQDDLAQLIDHIVWQNEHLKPDPKIVL